MTGVLHCVTISLSLFHSVERSDEERRFSANDKNRIRFLRLFACRTLDR